jgi:hypothetical protein
MSLYNDNSEISSLFNNNEGQMLAYQDGGLVFGIATDFVRAPIIVSPASGANVLEPFILKSSPFKIRGVDQSHSKTHWQLASDAGMTNLLVNTESASALEQITVAAQNPALSPFYTRVRHEGSVTGYSDWSEIVEFVHMEFTHRYSHADIGSANSQSTVFGSMLFSNSNPSKMTPDVVDYGSPQGVRTRTHFRIGWSGSEQDFGFAQFGSYEPYSDTKSDVTGLEVVWAERAAGELIVLFDRNGTTGETPVFTEAWYVEHQQSSWAPGFELRGTSWSPEELAAFWGQQFGQTREVLFIWTNIPPQ